MTGSDNKMKHLDFIQLTITRMAANSFLLKAWTITLMVALIALTADKENFLYVLVAIIPIVAFWLLDGYYLQQERHYRGLYNKVRKMNDSQIDFSLDANIKLLNPAKWLQSAFSKTLNLFYGGLIVALIAVVIILGVTHGS